jgi:hypothetical protein
MKGKINSQNLAVLVLLIGLFTSAGQVYSGELITEVVRTGSNSVPPEITEPFGEYAVCFVDRIYYYTNLPPELPDLVGAEYIVTADNDKNIDGLTMEVTISSDAVVYLILDNRLGGTGGGLGVDPILDEDLAWVYDLGFMDTGFDIKIVDDGGALKGYSSLFVAELPAGTHTFGEQLDGVIRNMYGIVAVPMEITVIPAAIDINPDVLNLRSHGYWVTCFLWLPEEYDLFDVDSSNLYLEEIVRADWASVDEVENTMVIKFPRDELLDILMPGERTLTVTGRMFDGTLFEGSDTIIVK